MTTELAEEVAPREPLSARPRTALLAMSPAVFVIANDLTTLGVALPSVANTPITPDTTNTH